MLLEISYPNDEEGLEKPLKSMEDYFTWETEEFRPETIANWVERTFDRIDPVYTYHRVSEKLHRYYQTVYNMLKTPRGLPEYAVRELIETNIDELETPFCNLFIELIVYINSVIPVESLPKGVGFRYVSVEKGKDVIKDITTVVCDERISIKDISAVYSPSKIDKNDDDIVQTLYTHLDNIQRCITELHKCVQNDIVIVNNMKMLFYRTLLSELGGVGLIVVPETGIYEDVDTGIYIKIVSQIAAINESCGWKNDRLSIGERNI